MNLSGDALPRRILRVAWVALLMALSGGALLALALAAGAADPPLAGPRTLVTARFERGEYELPAPPYTLEVEGIFPAAAPLEAHLRLDFFNPGEPPQHSLIVYSDGYFALLPYVPDPVSFIHVRRERNRVYLYVEPDGAATLRLNQEIAWQGKLAPARRVRIRGENAPPGQPIRFENLALSAAG